MADFPESVFVREEGPREGIQIETRPLKTENKIRFIESLAETGVEEIHCVSFVNPKKVPGMADAAEVIRGIDRRPGVKYLGLFLNMKGLERALTLPVDIEGAIRVSASESFSRRNTGMNLEETLEEQRRYLSVYKQRGIPVEFGYIMTSFGCNLEGEISTEQVVLMVRLLEKVAGEQGIRLRGIYLADTVGWATPPEIERKIGAVRERWPDFEIGLHLHDTRGVGLANAYAGLRLGVARFDTSCAGLGGCPFTGAGAAGNICTEDFVFMCEEMGISTGIDLERLIECGRLAEEIFFRTLPGKLVRAGSLKGFRRSHDVA
ncbi:MAG: hydroxymethylglutaryl-CoA lyase [Gammaproteobacteria bacterium]|nr:hydroxymethylglutaryl-CoA lyase [Gammaproteobacteria bacterium]MDE0413579.1 hydroxymethylglutaryl-CoA lyase [Gammaproteobacteria bacterium]